MDRLFSQDEMRRLSWPSDPFLLEREEGALLDLWMLSRPCYSRAKVRLPTKSRYSSCMALESLEETESIDLRQLAHVCHLQS
jgi:hypothetical protein